MIAGGSLKDSSSSPLFLQISDVQPPYLWGHASMNLPAVGQHASVKIQFELAVLSREPPTHLWLKALFFGGDNITGAGYNDGGTGANSGISDFCINCVMYCEYK